MECLLEANPSPEITWFQGNKVIADNSRVKMTRIPSGKDTFALALEITNPTIEDGGNYRCNACNTFGESNANIALNFQGGSWFYNRFKGRHDKVFGEAPTPRPRTRITVFNQLQQFTGPRSDFIRHSKPKPIYVEMSQMIDLNQ